MSDGNESDSSSASTSSSSSAASAASQKSNSSSSSSSSASEDVAAKASTGEEQARKRKVGEMSTGFDADAPAKRVAKGGDDHSEERSRTIFMGSLSYNSTAETLEALLSQFGTVENVKLMVHPDGTSKGVAFVRLGNVAEANAAVTGTHETEFEGRVLRVNMAGDPGRKDDNAGRKAGGTNPDATCYVGNLSFDISEEDLKSGFEDLGAIKSIKSLSNPDGTFRGIAFVEFVDAAAAAKACERNGFPFHGRDVRINMAGSKGGDKKEGASKWGDKAGGDRGKPPGDFGNPPSNTVFVSNLPFTATEEQLSGMFAEYGTINRMNMPTFEDSGKPRGFCIVEFGSTDEAEAAIKAGNNQFVEGRQIGCNFARVRDPNAPRPDRGGGMGRGRGRGGDRFGGGGRGRGGDRFGGGGRGRGDFGGGGRGRGGDRFGGGGRGRGRGGDRFDGGGRGRGGGGRGRGGVVSTNKPAAFAGSKMTFGDDSD